MMENTKRIFSIDVFRALTMLLMIFVNDLWTLKNVPLWLEHAEANQDFLGLSDVVFPCFLFILGMAIPFAIQNRIAKGDTHFHLVKHIITRSVALLIMGIFTVNVPEINSEMTGMSSETFQILMVLGFFLIWNVYPKADALKSKIFIGLQIIGVLILLRLAYIFKAGTNDNLIGITPQWWGILGLIGWTYLTSAIIYLFTYQKTYLLLIAFLFFNLLAIAGHAGLLQKIWTSGSSDWILANGALFAFAFAGILASVLLAEFSKVSNPYQLIGRYVLIGIVLIVFGFIARHFFIISKIQSTPTWVLLCSGIAFLCFALVYYLVDVKGKKAWFDGIKTAGTSTLTCYLIPYWYYSIANLLGITLPNFLTNGILGLIKSFIFAFLIIGITASLGKLNVKLKI